MQSFIDLMNLIYDFLKTPFVIWGYEMSFWGVLILTVLASIVFWFVGELFGS